MPLNALQISQLDAAAARRASNTASPTDLTNLSYAEKNQGYKYQPATPETQGVNPTLAAQAGLSPSDFLTLQEQGQTPANLVERRTVLREQYGVPTLEKASFAATPKTYTDIFNDAYSAAGLDKLKSEISLLDDQIAKRRNDLVTAEGQISDNPWISEASRVGRVNKLYETAQKEINNLIDQRNSKKSEYDTGVQRADLVAGKTLDQYTANRTLSQKQLDYYSGLAEQQLSTETEAEKAKRTQEAIKLLPAYLQAKVASGEAEAPKTIETAQGIMMWDRKQGKYVNTGYQPYRAPTSGGATTTAIQDMASRLQEVVGSDGFVSPDDYQAAKNNWVAAGKGAKLFDDTFANFRNPKNLDYNVAGQ